MEEHKELLKKIRVGEEKLEELQEKKDVAEEERIERLEVLKEWVVYNPAPFFLTAPKAVEGVGREE